MTGDHVRLAAVADLHCSKTGQGAFQPLFAQASAAADILVLCGDLTDHGLPEEAQVLAKELAGVRIPMVAVLGNHDYHHNEPNEVERILCAAGVQVLDGDDCEVLGVGFAGVKGFGGGFGRMALEAWGEDGIKKFVYEAVEESLKLEKALARLRTAQRVAVLHYAPIEATVEGEPQPLWPFLGSSRLEEPLNRYAVTAVLHGHAHHGSPEGKTAGGAPVYNVAMPVLRRAFTDRPAFRVIEVPALGRKSVEHVRQVHPGAVALVDEADPFHDALRGAVGRQRETDEVGPAEHLESDAHALPRQLRRQAAAPEFRGQAVAQFHLRAPFQGDPANAAAADELLRLRVACDPPAEAVAIPVARVALPGGLVLGLGAQTAQRRHHHRVGVHALEIVVVFRSGSAQQQARGPQLFEHGRPHQESFASF
jgi:Icc-related predicted phosphoesterase